LAGLVPALAQAQAQPRETLGLKDALERAYQHSPAVVRAGGDREVAKAAVRSASGAFLPTLSASLSTGLGGDTGGSGTNPSAGAGLSVSYDLFTGFRRAAQAEQAQASVTAAESGFVQDRASVALAVEQAYYAALRAEELLEVADARLTRAREGLDAAQRKAKVGSGAVSDELRAELELNTTQQRRLEATSQRDDAAYALGRLVGADGPVDAAAGAAAELPEGPTDANAFVTELLQSSPDIRAAEAQVRAADAAVAVAASSYYPQVGLGAGLDWSTRGAPLAGQAGWSVRLGVSLPLFDGFRRDESAVRARAQQTTAASLLADTRRAVRATAEQLLNSLELARQTIALAEKSQAVAAEDYRVQQERYRTGVATMLDLLTSQASLVQAQTDLVGARFDHRLAGAELQALLGRQS
jgi:outer membrane protein TolC